MRVDRHGRGVWVVKAFGSFEWLGCCGMSRRCISGRGWVGWIHCGLRVKLFSVAHYARMIGYEKITKAAEVVSCRSSSLRGVASSSGGVSGE